MKKDNYTNRWFANGTQCVQKNLTTLQLHKADRITFLNGYQATRISCTFNPAKFARKTGEGTVNEGKKVGKEENHSLKKTFRCVYAIKKDFWHKYLIL